MEQLTEIYLDPVVSKDRADTSTKGARPKPRPSRRTAPRPGARTRRGPCDPRDGRSDQRRPILPGEQDLASRRIRRLARRATGRSPHRGIATYSYGLLPGPSEPIRLLHKWRKRYKRLPTTRPTPRDVQEPIYIRKKCAIWTRWRLVPVKNVNYPRAPSSRRSGLVGPHATPAIVNYEYMTSTL